MNMKNSTNMMGWLMNSTRHTVNASQCDAVCGVCIDLHGKSRTGPSLCFQDYYLAPIFFLLFAALAVRRAMQLNAIPTASEPQKFWEKKDFLLVAVSLVHSLYGFMMVHGGDSAEDSTTLYYGFMAATWCACIYIIVGEARRKQPRGTEIRIIFLVNMLQQLVRLRIGLLHIAFMKEDSTGSTSSMRAWSDIASFVLAFFMTIAGLLEPAGTSDRDAYGELSDLSDIGNVRLDGEKSDQDSDKFVKEKTTHPSGEFNASWFSQMTFEWLTPMLKKGKLEQLTDGDMYALLPQDTSENSGRRLRTAWLKQLTKNPEDPSLLEALKEVWMRDFMLSGFFKLINDSVVFVGPLLLQSLVQVLSLQPQLESRSNVRHCFTSAKVHTLT
jgi:hypothetical protein